MPRDSTELLLKAFQQLCTAMALMVQAGQTEDGPLRPDGPGALDRKGTAKYLSIGLTKLGELVRDGKLPKGVDLGGRPHWFRDDLDKYLRKIKRQNGD